MSENILNFYMGLWVFPCLLQLLFNLYIFFYVSPKSLLTFLVMLLWIRKKELLTRLWRSFYSKIFQQKSGSFWKLLVLSAYDVRECLFCCNIAELITCMIKKCKETYDCPLAVLWCSYSRLLRFFLSYSLIIFTLLRQQGQCFLESWSWSRTSLGKIFLT